MKNPEESQLDTIIQQEDEKEDSLEKCLPELPEGWKWRRLGDISKIHYGKGLSKENRIPNGKYGVFGSNGIIDKSDTYLIDFPTIIIGRKGSIGALTLVKESCWPIDTTFYIKLYDYNKISIDFLYFILHNIDFSLISITTTKPGINRQDLENVKIPLPPIKEQKCIVSRIEEITSRIEQAKRLREEAQRDVEAVMHSALNRVFSRAEEKKYALRLLEGGHQELIIMNIMMEISCG